MTVSASDYAFLSKEWRWAEVSDSAIKTRHSGAREADRESPLLDSAGASSVVTAIHSVLSANNRMMVVTVGGILPLTFKIRPPVVRLYYSRFDLAAGRDMMCHRADKVWSKNQTILYLFG